MLRTICRTLAVFAPVVVLLFVALLPGGVRVHGRALAATHQLPSCDEAGFNTALAAAQADAGLGIVTFPPGCTGDFPLTTQKSIAADVLIDGGGVITLTAASGLRHFYVDNSGQLALQDIVLKGGGTSVQGGSIYVSGGELATLRVLFTGNDSDSSAGGAIYADNGTLRIAKSVFRANKGGVSGGALHAVESSLWVTDSLFISNTLPYTGTPNSGGALYARDGIVTQIVNSVFEGNRARTGWGGALWVQNGPLNIARTDFVNNRVGGPAEASQSNGGAIYLQSVYPLRLVGSSLAENYSAGRGGALYAQGSQLQITRTVFLSNSTDWQGMDGQGGAIYAGGAAPGSAIYASTFLSNYASYSGGAIYNTLSDADLPIPISSSTYAFNRAQVEGAALRYFRIGIVAPFELVIENSTFYSNTGTSFPLDAINAFKVPLKLNHITLAGSGEGVMIREADATIANSILNGNDGSCGAITASIVMSYSVSDDNDCHFGGNNNVNDVVELGELQDNGGASFTILPAVGSVAVDAIPAGLCLPTDQRGVTRPQEALCDMGAAEVAPADPGPVAATATAIAQLTATAQATLTGTATPTETPTPTATSTSPATQTAVAATQTAIAATATAQASLTPQPLPSPNASVTPAAPSVFLNPVQVATTP